MEKCTEGWSAGSGLKTACLDEFCLNFSLTSVPIQVFFWKPIRKKILYRICFTPPLLLVFELRNKFSSVFLFVFLFLFFF